MNCDHCGAPSSGGPRCDYCRALYPRAASPFLPAGFFAPDPGEIIEYDPHLPPPMPISGTDLWYIQLRRTP